MQLNEIHEKVRKFLQSYQENFSEWLGSNSKISKKLALMLGHTDTGVNDGYDNKKAQTSLEVAYDHYSIQELLSYDMYDPESQIYINRHSLGWGLLLSPATGSDEEFVQILTSVVTDVLPAGGDLQILLWGSPKIGLALDKALENCSQRGGEFARLAKLQIDHLKNGAHNSLSHSSDYYLRDLQAFIFFSVSKNHKEANIDSLSQYRDDVSSSLKSINLSSETIPIETMLNLLNDLLSSNDSLYKENIAWNPQDTIAQQITDVEQLIEIKSNHLCFKTESKETEVRCFSVKSFPKMMTQWKMNDAIGQLFNSSLQIPCQYLISLNIHLIDNEKSNNQVQTKILGKDNKAKNSQMLNWLPSLSREYQDWQFMRDRLAEGDRLVHTYFQVILIDNPEKMARSERKLRDLYQSNGWKLRCDAYLQLQSFLAAMPMMMSEGLYEDLKHFGRLKTMTAFNAMNIAPLQGEWKGYTNPLVILPGRRGQICWWNPFANDQGNYNTAIAAGSGKGKSVFVQYYITSLLGSGGRCWVIDIGHSYEKTCRLLNGEFIAFSIENPICLNFFTYVRTDQDFKENLPLLVPLVASMARQKSETSEEEDKFIEKAISDAWHKKNYRATVTTIKECLETYHHPVADNLSHLLISYAKGGMYADFFEGACEINFDNPFIVLELLGLKNKKSLQRVVLFALITRIHQAMYLTARDTCKSCIIDEAWDLLGDETGNAAKFIETGYRTARRHNANFVSITQSINDYYKNSTSLAAFMNADFTMVLGQKPQDIDQLEKDDRFPVDGFIKRLLKSLRMVDKEYSECLIQSPHGMTVHRIVLAPYIRVLFSSKGPEFEAVNQLQKKGLSLHEAVLTVSQNKQGEFLK